MDMLYVHAKTMRIKEKQAIKNEYLANCYLKKVPPLLTPNIYPSNVPFIKLSVRHKQN